MRKFENIIILAAGESSRFWPLGNKNLFKLKGKSLISYQIDNFCNLSEKLVIVCCQENFEEVSAIAQKKTNIEIIIQEGIGQSAALISAAKKIETKEALVVNAVDFFDIEKVLSSMEPDIERAKLILTAKELSSYFPGGYLKLEGNHLLEVIEKPSPNSLPSNKVRLVIDYFSDFKEFVAVLNSFETPLKDGIFENGLNLYIKKYPASVFYVDYKDYWISIKYPWNILDLIEHMLGGIKGYMGKNTKFGKNVSMMGEVEIGDNVEIGDFVRIVGPTVISANTKVGNFAMIVNSLIEKDCLIGGYSEVTRSYLGHGVRLHRNYIGDSVLLDKVLLGAGAILANLRLDGTNVGSFIKGEKIDTQRVKLGSFLGRGVKLGVNSSIMPGIKIKEGSQIGPNQIILRDVNE